jgi:hypothetical protein
MYTAGGDGDRQQPWLPDAGFASHPACLDGVN